MILKNSKRCNHCNDEIESKHRHDFVTCFCGKISVDGGKDYGRTLFTELSDFTDTSIDDDGTHELRRQYITWGKSYDKDMNKLPKTIYIPIKDMTSDHIQAILDGDWAKNNPFYEELFKEELKFRIKESV
ncbi:MAG: DUF7695 domain-containing protein [Gloeomargaritales cyanobacterium]